MRIAAGSVCTGMLLALGSAGCAWAGADASGLEEAHRAEADRRAAAVEAQMTDAERLQLLHGVMPLAFPGQPAPPEGVKPTAGYIRGIPRLGVPDLLETDASLGVTNPLQLRPADVATAMPAGLALASSFDPELAHLEGATIGSEARAKGFNVLLGGGANLTRDPRNGRNFEYLGEDPLLAGELAGAHIAGVQSQGVISTVKHFALNNQETLRQSVDARIDESGLRESDLLAFQLAIERGEPGSVMCAYNKVNGEYACGNDWLLNRVLKRDWRYKGWVMSDWGAAHDVSYFSKGLDQQSGEQLDAQVWFGAPLQQELTAGRVSRDQISAAVRRILRSIYAVGVDRPATETSVDYVAHAQVARRVAEEGIVLLKNDSILPLAGPKRVLVIGGHADVGVLSGGGSSQVTPYGGSPTLIPVGGRGMMALFSRQLFMPSSPLAALKKALPETVVEYESGYDPETAAAAAAHADVAIVFATQWQTEGSDHASMSLPEGQDALIAAVARANNHTVVVLETGNPVKMPWLADVAAVLESWYPGQEGGTAIASVLVGSINPSGHLSMSFPKDESQLPRPAVPGLGLPEHTEGTVNYSEGAQVGYRWFAAKQTQSLFPFGHGLSYTTFELGKLEIHPPRAAITARFTVENTGKRSGASVAQVYMTDAAGRPLQRLVAFNRVTLNPGERRSVQVTIDPRVLAAWDTDAQRWRIAPGRYSFALGASAADLGSSISVQLTERNLP